MAAIIDIHTHLLPIDPLKAIWNCTLNQLSTLSEVSYASIGLHPWHLSSHSLPEQKEHLAAAALLPQIFAIGEAGIDKVCSTPISLQMDAFLFQIKLAERLGLPLILHVVKAHNEVMELKRSLSPSNDWIIHGFRGKPELAKQYLDLGFYLSYGALYNSASLLFTPINRLFFETDESPISIFQIYDDAARLLSVSSSDLIAKVSQNADKVFFNH